MKIPMDKLIAVRSNKYLFVKAAMAAVDRAGNMKDYPEVSSNWKIVPKILNLQLNEKFQFRKSSGEEEA